jgi:transcription elongation factor GreA
MANELPPGASRLDAVDSDVHITPEGLAAVRQELDQLVAVRRPEITSKIKAARELGDLSENFEYHSAKNEQGFIEARIAELEAIVRNHVLIELPAPTGEVLLGSTVTLLEEGGPPERYRIVGPAEADPGAGRISNESPLGSALMGRRSGDEVEVRAPSGESYTVRVQSVE